MSSCSDTSSLLMEHCVTQYVRGKLMLNEISLTIHEAIRELCKTVFPGTEKNDHKESVRIGYNLKFIFLLITFLNSF